MYRIYLEIDGWSKTMLVDDELYNSGVVNVAFPHTSHFLLETNGCLSAGDMAMHTRLFKRTDRKKNGLYVFEAT